MSPKKDEYMRGYADGFKDGRISRLIVPQAQVDTGAAYHWREGLYFRRHDETVEIVQMRSTEQVAWRWLIPEVEWQSILNYLGSNIQMQPPAGETIRSTQDGSMEGASVTVQSAVDASSPTLIITPEMVTDMGMRGARGESSIEVADQVENITDNPKSWIAWKREAERLQEQSDALRRRNAELMSTLSRMAGDA